VRELTSTVTIKGQVTLPVEIRRFLKIGPRDRVAFVVDDDHVEIRRTESVVARTAGVFRTQEEPLSAERLRAEAEIAWATDVEERAGA
jgi:AbrB family looped-hinge helix DNA binding protein